MRKEKGSITLFVIISMLFFLVIVGITAIYVTNKSASIDRQIAQVKESYEKNVENIDEVYKEIVESNTKIKIDIQKNTEETTNLLILTGNALVVEDKNMEEINTIEFWAFADEKVQNIRNLDSIDWTPTKNSEKKELEKEYTVNENGTYSFLVIDKNGKIYGDYIVIDNIAD